MAKIYFKPFLTLSFQDKKGSVPEKGDDSLFE